MATITKKVCDRCGKEIKYLGWTSKLENVFKKGSRISYLSIYNGNPSGYEYNRQQFEMCAECTKDFREFLLGEEQK